jgi:hypothetical protein
MTPTRSAAKAALMRAYPGRSVLIAIDDWHFRGEGVTAPRNEVIYKVSVLPGVNGEECSSWHGKTLGEVAQKALDNAPEPTEDELNRQFAECEAEPAAF